MRRFVVQISVAVLCCGGACAPLHAGETQEGRAETIEALIAALKSDDPAAMVKAADALERLGPEAQAAAPALAARLEYPQPWPRSAAMNALKAIGAAAVPAIVDVFEHGSPAAQQRASTVLGWIGPDAKEAVPALQKAIEKASPAQRERLAETLRFIEAETADAQQPQLRKPADGVTVLAAVKSDLKLDYASGDWPQFHGPRRDSLCRERGLLKEWPAGGPELLWKLAGLGRGYSTVAIAGGMLVTMGDRRDGQAESQFALAYDLATPRELWATRIGPPHEDGPRCTPTIDGELLYALGTKGDLVCLETKTGKLRWQKSLVADFDGKMMTGWKFSESPLVDGEKVICTPGGPQAALVALEKTTGKVLWKSVISDLGRKGKDGAAYASAIVAESGGVRQYIQVLGRGVVGIDAQSGKFLWGYNRIASQTANITHPLVRGDYVFVTNSYQTGSALLKISRDGEALKAEEVYFLAAREFENHHGGIVLIGDYIYGGSGQSRGDPVCLELATGRIAWKAKAPAPGSAAVLYADGCLVFRYDRGLVALVEATPAAYRLKATFQPILGEGAAWSHPVIHQGKLYLRHSDLLLCYDVQQPSATGRR